MAFTVECKVIVYFLGTIWSIVLLTLARFAVVKVWKRVGQECRSWSIFMGTSPPLMFVFVSSNSVSLTLKLALKGKRMLQIPSTDMGLLLDLHDIVWILLLACCSCTVMLHAINGTKLLLSIILSTVELKYNNPFVRLLEYIVILMYQLISNKAYVFLPCLV